MKAGRSKWRIQYSSGGNSIEIGYVPLSLSSALVLQKENALGTHFSGRKMLERELSLKMRTTANWMEAWGGRSGFIESFFFFVVVVDDDEKKAK